MWQGRFASGSRKECPLAIRYLQNVLPEKRIKRPTGSERLSLIISPRNRPSTELDPGITKTYLKEAKSTKSFQFTTSAFKHGGSLDNLTNFHDEEHLRS